MNLTPFNTSISEVSAFPEQIHFSDVLTDFCMQIDRKLLLGGFFILSYFVFKNFILPLAYNGFKSYLENTSYKWLLTDYINKAYDRALSLLETFAIGSAIFIMIIFYYQNSFPTWLWVFIVIYSLFFGSFIVSWIVGQIRGKLSK